MTLGVR